MNNELKVSFYIKREKSATNACGIYPVIGKIIVVKQNDSGSGVTYLYVAHFEIRRIVHPNTAF